MVVHLHFVKRFARCIKVTALRIEQYMLLKAVTADRGTERMGIVHTTLFRVVAIRGGALYGAMRQIGVAATGLVRLGTCVRMVARLSPALLML